MATQRQMPTRTATAGTDDEAVPDEDSSEVTKLFLERLQAWKHACGYLEDYITATEKMHTGFHKDYEKVLKTVSSPLKEGHHFDQQLGGVAGLFDNIRSNTQGIANSQTDTATILKGTILPMFERLHSEIKNKNKEITKGAGKGAKNVDKARNTSQKHIELLGQHTASFSSRGGSIKAAEDPYLIQRGVHHRLYKQIQEENANRQDMITVQNQFADFEAHVVQTFQQGLTQLSQTLGKQNDTVKNMYLDMDVTSKKIAPNFEWNGFMTRNKDVLIDPNGAPRSVESINFPNQNHQATQPLIAGSLEKKGKMFKSYSTGYYVVTPSKFLHEFKTDDDFSKEPSPENSLYLPDCMIGAVDGLKFQVKGKDASKGSIGNKFSMSHDFAFKAHTPADAQKWHDVISRVAGQTTTDAPDTSAPTSPTDGQPHINAFSPTTTGPAAANTTTQPGHAVTPGAGQPTAGHAQGVAAADKAV